MRIHYLFLILYKKHHVWKQRASDRRNQEKKYFRTSADSFCMMRQYIFNHLRHPCITRSYEIFVELVLAVNWPFLV